MGSRCVLLPTILAAVVLGASCGRAAPGAVAGAAYMTGIAAASSAISRGFGGCYASCTNGTFCNRDTGLCEPIDCGGCARGETCDPTTRRCVLRAVPRVGRPEDDPPIDTAADDWRRAGGDAPAADREARSHPVRLRLPPGLEVRTSSRAGR